IDGRLLGTITNDDIIDVIAEEATEDLMRVAGGSEEELHQPSVVKSFSSRIPWLVSTFAVGCVTTVLLATQKNVLTEVVAVSFYIPITMAFGGNVGLQTATMTIRRIVLGETGARGLISDLWRELRVGILLGAMFGIVMGTAAGFVMPQADPRLGFVVGLAILAAASTAAMVGTLIPIILQKISVDPSVGGSPIVTSLDDLSALGIYFILIHLML
ncbi:MAG: magnesium transporter, partial [bacterium]